MFDDDEVYAFSHARLLVELAEAGAGLAQARADLRDIIADHPDLQERLPELEGRLDYYDAEEAVFAAISGPGS